MITCYPQPGKPKSRRLLEAFAEGCGGRVTESRLLEPGPAAFYGCVGIEPLLHAARCRNEDWYYLDNSWFDVSRGTHFRVGRNGLQRGTAPADHDRARQLGLKVEPWRKSGRHVLVVKQSDYFMSNVAGWAPNLWQHYVSRRIRSATERPIVVRHWSNDKAARAASLHEDLKDCWALVTHSSAAANEALLAGVPVFVTTSDCAAFPLAGERWSIEQPSYPDDREQWAAELAARQWTLEELRSGAAWRKLHA